ncbi:hypothetical protein [Pseudopedobacter beijingensis]|uniref:Uncharacterized protein n=1 Tax=Pseudopedobacter beijingensis TaxID=1207056 RepID=A0ABW4IEL3_9SPHI
MGKKFIRFISFAVLASVLQIAIPFHEILHYHKESAYGSHKYTEVHEHENPCCKPVNYFHFTAALLGKQIFVFSSLSFFYKAQVQIGNYYNTVLLPSNKAPPVKIA